MNDTTDKGSDEAPRFWGSWKRLYATLIVYWLALLALMLLATRWLSR